jgi:hypothetical protein
MCLGVVAISIVSISLVFAEICIILIVGTLSILFVWPDVGKVIYRSYSFVICSKKVVVDNEIWRGTNNYKYIQTNSSCIPLQCLVVACPPALYLLKYASSILWAIS